MRLLVLGGTREAREVAAGAVAAGHAVVTSLAGVTSAPLEVAGELRIGGFGGADGLRDWLREQGTDAVIDATHPFAAQMSASAALACAEAAVPLLGLQRPSLQAGPGDRWTRVPDVEAAARAIPAGARVFLALGRQQLDAFAGVRDAWCLARMIEPPAEPVPPHVEVVLGRGPFALADELDLLRTNDISLVVVRDAGGATADAKLRAARELGIDVLVVDRPPPPAGVPLVAGVDEALGWLDAQDREVRDGEASRRSRTSLEA